MGLLSERVGEEYEVAYSQLPLGIFGRSEFEILRDKRNHAVLYPSSVNSHASFFKFRYVKESLEKLDAGFAPDGTGTQVVGRFESFVARRFVDGFVGCMSNVYNNSWETMHVWIRGQLQPRALPVFFVGKPLTIAISPYIFGNQRLEPTAKYQPVSSG